MTPDHKLRQNPDKRYYPGHQQLTHFYKLKNTHSPLYLYGPIPAELELSYNFRMLHPYDSQIQRTPILKIVSVNGVGWMFLSIHVQPYLNLKRDYCCVLDPPKDLYLTFMTLQESSFLLDSELNLAISMNTDLGTTFYNLLCSSPFCSCQTGIEDNDRFPLHCPCFSSRRRDFLDLLSRSIGFDIMRLSSKELTTL